MSVSAIIEVDAEMEPLPDGIQITKEGGDAQKKMKVKTNGEKTKGKLGDKLDKGKNVKSTFDDLRMLHYNCNCGEPQEF